MASSPPFHHPEGLLQALLTTQGQLMHLTATSSVPISGPALHFCRTPRAVAALIDAHCDVNVVCSTRSQTSYQGTFLARVCCGRWNSEQEAVSMMSMLLERGHADMEKQSRYGGGKGGVCYHSPLMAACSEGYIRRAERLIYSGADLLQAIRLNQHEEPKTALMVAAGVEHMVPIVDLLLEYGAPVDTTDPSGWTAFTYAVVAHRIPAMKVLYQHRADINHMDFSGTAPVIYACRSSSTVEGRSTLNALIAMTGGPGLVDLHVTDQFGHTAAEIIAAQRATEHPRVSSGASSTATRTPKRQESCCVA